MTNARPRCTPPRAARRLLAAGAMTLAAALLAGCGGGGDDGGPAPDPQSCTLAEHKSRLGAYMDEWYFWYRLSPRPNPDPFTSADDYLSALLYTGTDPAFPADRWSSSEPSASFDDFFGRGLTLGYGLFVAGLEVAGHPERPLMVRYIEPGSDAAVQGVRRGDQILSMNGRPASELVAANDFSALSPAQPGDRVTVQLRDAAGAQRSVSLLATRYALTPVSTTAVVQTPAGRRMGYVLVKDMISQALAPLDAAFVQLRAAGVTELVLDLRYNGGGLVSTAAEIASYVGGARTAGQPFATLLYNDRRAAFNNETFRFANPQAALALNRVYVLTGPRTCSASEQIINSLRPFVEVVLIGDTTCGKPVGFLPRAMCGLTYSVVNYESVNARNEGRYFDGFDATCPAADDLTRPLGAPDERLLATARLHADSGQCPVIFAAGAPQRRAAADRAAERAAARRVVEPGERRQMIAR